MTGWLLDTNVLSELRRPRPDPRVVAFVSGARLDYLYLSAVTLAEIRFGIERVPDDVRRAELEAWLAAEVRPLFERRILAITEDVMVTWRHLVEAGRKARHTFSQPDLITAATAIRHGLGLATRDVAGYDRTGVPIFDPWSDAPPNFEA